MSAVSAESQLMVFDLAGVMVSSGSACSSGKVAKSHVLRAMGIADDVAETAIRVSLGWTTTEADIDRFIAAWTAVYRRTQTNVRKVA
jgi:cysteine desulfurase